MASALRSECARCGPVEVPISGAELLINVGEQGTRIGNVVEFVCPHCSRRGFQPVDERGTRLLSSAGVRVAMAASGTGGVSVQVPPHENRS